MFSLFSFTLYILLAAVGFMMGFLYKNATTTAQFLKPDPKKSLKIFLAVLGAALLVTFVLSYLTSNALSSSKIPEEGSMQYQNTRSVMIFMLNFFFFLLVVLSNAYSQSLQKLSPVPYLLAAGFYMAFVLKDGYYISDYFALWQKSVNLFKGDLPDFHGTAWLKCGLGLLVIAFNGFMVWWGFRK